MVSFFIPGGQFKGVVKTASKSLVGTGTKVLNDVKRIRADERGAISINSGKNSPLSKDLPTMEFSRNSVPNIADNIETAHAEGKSQILTYLGPKNPQTKINRKEATKGHDYSTGSPDEYPFASTNEGGKGSRVQGVPLVEQKRQGGTMSAFYKANNLQAGDQFRVRIVP